MTPCTEREVKCEKRCGTSVVEVNYPGTYLPGKPYVTIAWTKGSDRDTGWPIVIVNLAI